MTTAFVLTGGGSLGAVQVGMLGALAERGVEPDLVLGTSIGAINAAWVATHPGPAGVEELARVRCRVRREHIFPGRLLVGLRGIAGRADHLVDPHGLRRLLDESFGSTRVEGSATPLAVVAVALDNGAETLITRGPIVEAVMASAALPGVFPPVWIDGHPHVDGGVANNAPISHALELGATAVYVLATGFACAAGATPRSALGVAFHSLTLLIQRRLREDVERHAGTLDLRVMPPLCPLAVSPLDFTRTSELIERAREQTAAWLDRPGTTAEVTARLAPHEHRPGAARD